MASASVKDTLTVVFTATAVDDDFSVTPVSLTLTRPLTVIDFEFITQANGGGGSTVVLRNAGTQICTAVSTTNNALTRAAALVNAQVNVATGAALSLLASGGTPANVRGTAYALVIPGAIT